MVSASYCVRPIICGMHGSGPSHRGGATLTLKLTEISQSATMGSVVKVLPGSVPWQLPSTVSIAKPSSAVMVMSKVFPSSTTCVAQGHTEPLSPALTRHQELDASERKASLGWASSTNDEAAICASVALAFQASGAPSSSESTDAAGSSGKASSESMTPSPSESASVDDCQVNSPHFPLTPNGCGMYAGKKSTN